jgi:hypothetical protein
VRVAILYRIFGCFEMHASCFVCRELSGATVHGIRNRAGVAICSCTRYDQAACMAYRNVGGTVLFRLKLSQLFGFVNLLKSCFGGLQLDQMMLAVGRWGGT